MLIYMAYELVCDLHITRASNIPIIIFATKAARNGGV